MSNKIIRNRPVPKASQYSKIYGNSYLNIIFVMAVIYKLTCINLNLNQKQFAKLLCGDMIVPPPNEIRKGTWRQLWCSRKLVLMSSYNPCDVACILWGRREHFVVSLYEFFYVIACILCMYVTMCASQNICDDVTKCTCNGEWRYCYLIVALQNDTIH